MNDARFGLLLTVVIAAVVASCDDGGTTSVSGGSDPSDAASVTADDPEPSGGTVPSSGSTPDAATDDPVADSGSVPAAGAPFFVRYVAVDETGAETVTLIVSRPPDLVVGDDSSRTYVVGGEGFSCDFVDTTCEALPPEVSESLAAGGYGATLAGLGEEIISAAETSGAVEEAGEETVAGRPARCYLFAAAAIGQESDTTICVDAELGVAVSAVFDTTTVAATEVRAPTDDDFAIPF